MATTLEVEVMYSALDTTGLFKRKRVGLEAAETLDRDNVLWVILSAITTSARSRRTLNGNSWERAGEVRLIDSTDAALLSRHGGEVSLASILETDFWVWKLEDNPLAAVEISGIPIVLPRKTITFNAPAAFTHTMSANARAQAQADLF